MKEKVLLEALKKALKTKGISYDQLAQALGVSLSTVKRDFSLHKMGLSRFLQICEISKISLKELSTFDEKREKVQQTLTLEQEQFFARNIKYWAYYDQLLAGRTPKELAKAYKIPKDQEVKYLNKLDKFKLIEWGPGDKIKVLVESIIWRKDGPLREKYLTLNERDFLKSDFEEDFEFYSFFVDEIPKSAMYKVIEDFRKIENYIELENEISRLSGKRPDSIGVMMGIRPWNYNPLEEN